MSPQPPYGMLYQFKVWDPVSSDPRQVNGAPRNDPRSDPRQAPANAGNENAIFPRVFCCVLNKTIESGYFHVNARKFYSAEGLELLISRAPEGYSDFASGLVFMRFGANKADANNESSKVAELNKRLQQLELKNEELRMQVEVLEMKARHAALQTEMLRGYVKRKNGGDIVCDSGSSNGPERDSEGTEAERPPEDRNPSGAIEVDAPHDGVAEAHSDGTITPISQDGPADAPKVSNLRHPADGVSSNKIASFAVGASFAVAAPRSLHNISVRRGPEGWIATNDSKKGLLPGRIPSFPSFVIASNGSVCFYSPMRAYGYPRHWAHFSDSSDHIIQIVDFPPLDAFIMLCARGIKVLPYNNNGRSSFTHKLPERALRMTVSSEYDCLIVALKSRHGRGPPTMISLFEVKPDTLLHIGELPLALDPSCLIAGARCSLAIGRNGIHIIPGNLKEFRLLEDFVKRIGHLPVLDGLPGQRGAFNASGDSLAVLGFDKRSITWLDMPREGIYKLENRVMKKVPLIYQRSVLHDKAILDVWWAEGDGQSPKHIEFLES